MCDKWYKFSSIGVSPDVERVLEVFGVVAEPLDQEVTELQWGGYIPNLVPFWLPGKGKSRPNRRINKQDVCYLRKMDIPLVVLLACKPAAAAAAADETRRLEYLRPWVWIDLQAWQAAIVGLHHESDGTCVSALEMDVNMIS